MLTQSTLRPAAQPALSSLGQRARWTLAGLLALGVAGGVWFGLPALSAHARLAFITFGLAVVGWVLTEIDDTLIALAAAITFTVVGVDEPAEFFETLGDASIWLLLASFIIAAAVAASGLSSRFTLWLATRATSVQRLFWLLTFGLMATAFVIPATSGRAALMLPIFTALAAGIGEARITRALALLFPTILLLSAIASLIGAGAHLITAEILGRMGGEQLGFGRWLALGLPFAAVSCALSTWVILHLFLNGRERRRPLALTAASLAAAAGKSGRAINLAGPLTRGEKFVLGLVAALTLLWMTESLHGVHQTIVALLGAIALTAPRFGVIALKDALKKVEWTMLLFMAATLELGEALIESGAAAWLVQGFFALLHQGAAGSVELVVAGVALASLLAHLFITSRTARSSVLVPVAALLGAALGYNPTMLAFLSTAAAGFCLTLTVSAKPVAMFSQIEDAPTYQPRDLLKLSGVLLPVHFALLLVFALYVWPLLGLRLTPPPETTPPAPGWHEAAALHTPGLPGADDPRPADAPPTPVPTPLAAFDASAAPSAAADSAPPTRLPPLRPTQEKRP